MLHEIIRYWEVQTGEDAQRVDILYFPKNVTAGKYELAHLIKETNKKTILVYAPNNEGGNRLAKIAEEAHVAFEGFSKAHHKLIAVNPKRFSQDIVDKWLEGGDLQYIEAMGYWSRPGLFSWDEVDVATKLLLEKLPVLEGVGADLGCGYGALSIPLLKNEKITKIYAVDKDEGAIEAYKKNITALSALPSDGKAAAIILPVIKIAVANIEKAALPFKDLDFVVMNPPFHHGTQKADIALGVAFFQRAAEALREGGVLWAVANKHLPYEEEAAKHFTQFEVMATKGAFKIIKAIK